MPPQAQKNIHPRPYDPSRRPPTIAELASMALSDLWDPNRELKAYLRAAEHYRKSGKVYADANDLEMAFVQFAKAATIVLEKLPTHRDYYTLLSATQRHNLGLNGQDILDNLSSLKPTLVERHERWLRQHPEEADSGDQPRPSRPSGHGTPEFSRSRSPYTRTPSRPPDPSPRRGATNGHRAADDDRARQAALWEGDSYREYGRTDTNALEERREADRRDWQTQRREENVRPPRWTVDANTSRDVDFGRRPPEREYSRDRTGGDRHDVFVSTPQSINPGDSRWEPKRRLSDDERLREEEFIRKHQEDIAAELEESRKRREEDAIRRQQEEDTKRRVEERRAQEQEGIVRRQQESEAAARAARNAPPVHTPDIVAPQPVSYTSQSRTPSRVSDSDQSIDMHPFPMPLQSPSRFDGDDTTDSEAPQNSQLTIRGRRFGAADYATPTRRAPLYPTPITTTSPPPPDIKRIEYPSLMSSHQMTQGYSPSLQSMFKPPKKPSPNSTLLFISDSSSSLYPSEALPRPSMPVSHQVGYPPQSHQHRHPHAPHQHPHPQYPGPTRAPQLPPPPPVPAPPSSFTPPGSRDSRIVRPVDPLAEPAPRELKTVNVPRDCLPRFLSIAALNTAQNRETCGLLLGKDKGHKYLVTTLLIPKQHSTSDTCTMDEEELVLQFTEERSLITLGWIHTHPSQSCFMSSVDLHTHSGFQRMLPESFAVVCAPKSQPNFGIFRLTDPPGLQTILGCSAKEAFHPHADLPIYTDADKGHVVMKDVSLEIVDLR